MQDEYVIDVSSSATGPGYCKVCGNEADGPRTTYCEDHRPAPSGTKAQGKSLAQRNKSNSSAKPRNSASISDKKAAGSFAKLFIIISAIWAWTALRRYGIPDLTGQLSEELAFTDEEAADIARPVGRFMMSNSTTARIVGPIVENDDLVDAAFAVWEWQKRVNATLAQYKGHQIQDNQRSTNNVATQQNEVSPVDSGRFNPLDGGYDANADFRTVV